MLLIGSRASKYHWPTFRQPKDWDYIATPEEVLAWTEFNKHVMMDYQIKGDYKLRATIFDEQWDEPRRYEIEVTKPGHSSEILYDYNASIIKYNNCRLDNGDIVASPLSLLRLKESHIYHPIHWLKNIEDYHWLKSKVSDTGNLQSFVKMRRSEVDAREKKRKVNLNMSNDEFFGRSETALKRSFAHDDLHKATCFYEIPLFESLKKDKNKARLDEQLFRQLDQSDKVRLAQEECFAIALERRIIPEMGEVNKHNALEAYMWAVERVSTRLSTGWFQDFCIENYPSIKNMPYDYVSKFYKALYSGKIRRKDTNHVII